MFVYAADIAETSATPAASASTPRSTSVRWPDVRDRIFGRIDPISEGGRDYRADGPNTTAYFGQARFTGDRELTVALDRRARGDADGRPGRRRRRRPPRHPRRHHRQSACRSTPPTRSCASTRCPSGSRSSAAASSPPRWPTSSRRSASTVTVVARGAAPAAPPRRRDLRSASPTSPASVGRAHRRHGRARSRRGDGGAGVRLRLADGTQRRGRPAPRRDRTRRANTPTSAPTPAASSLLDDGRIAVDEHGRTSAPGVWALGDVSSPHQLKHVANAEARAVAHNLVHPDDLRSSDHEHVPVRRSSATPRSPRVGLTRAGVRRRGRARTSRTCRLRRHGIRLGHGGHDERLQADRRPGHRAAPRGPPHGAAGHDASSSRSSRRWPSGPAVARRGARAVLDPPGARRGRRERAARPASSTSTRP